jgi:uncharacterized protein (TIGR02217 family)
MLFFPNLPGVTWPVKKTPIWKTQLVEHSSGREARAGLWQSPRYLFELSYDGLSSTDTAHLGLGAHSLQILMDFFNQCQGMLNPFIYQDLSDCIVSGQVLGVGDGLTTTYKAKRTLVVGVESVSWILYVNAVYLDNVLVTNWDLSLPNSIVFTSAPASGAVITADFVYGFKCRWDSDEQEFTQFMSNVWSASGVKFKSVR